MKIFIFGQIKKLARTICPSIVWVCFKKVFYRITGRFVGETSKARARRKREKFFQKYCQGKGIDIGCGDDKLTWKCDGWDMQNGDAQYLQGVPDRFYDFVYSSHTLEHMVSPEIALSTWWRVIKVGGYLLLYIPHRDLYERNTTLPSRWNPDHKHYFLLDHDETPCTLGIVPLIIRTLEDAEIIYAKVCSDGYISDNTNNCCNGEYSIEIVIQKKDKKSKLKW